MNDKIKTIWITGGRGFIGRCLAMRASQAAVKVYGIGHGFWTAEEAGQCGFSSWVNGEIESTNLKQLAQLSGLPDVVFHLAGGSSVGLSMLNPSEYFRRTVETTSRLVEWLRTESVLSRLVCVSSAAVYGSGHLGTIPENARVSPYSPYGYHKLMMENICSSYSQNFGIQSCIVRLFSVYGVALKKQLIWDIFGKLDANSSGPLTLGGTGREIRDWLYISDAVKLLWTAATSSSPNCSVINGGSGVGVSVSAIARLVCNAWGTDVDIAFSGVSRKGDPDSLVANISRARHLGFECEVTLKDGILNTLKWYRGEECF